MISSSDIEHKLSLVMYGFRDLTGVKVPNADCNSSSDSSEGLSKWSWLSGALSQSKAQLAWTGLILKTRLIEFLEKGIVELDSNRFWDHSSTLYLNRTCWFIENIMWTILALLPFKPEAGEWGCVRARRTQNKGIDFTYSVWKWTESVEPSPEQLFCGLSISSIGYNSISRSTKQPDRLEIPIRRQNESFHIMPGGS